VRGSKLGGRAERRSKGCGWLGGELAEVCAIKRRRLASLSSFVRKGRANVSAVANVTQLEGKSEKPAELSERLFSCYGRSSLEMEQRLSDGNCRFSWNSGCCTKPAPFRPSRHK